MEGGIDPTSVEGALHVPYAIPNRTLGLSTTDVRVPVLWWRSVGSTHTAFVVETFIDELAEAAGKDPLDFRLKNGAKEGTKAAHGPTFPRIGYIETVEAAKASPHYAAPLGDADQFGRTGAHLGHGAGRRVQVVDVHGLNGIDDHDLRRIGPVEARQYVADVGGSRQVHVWCRQI